MESSLAEILPAGAIRLLPGVLYLVTRRFEDDGGTVHPAGEMWRFLGYETRRLSGAHVLYVLNGHGEEVTFCLTPRRTPAYPSKVLDEFERYVVGPNVESAAIVEAFSPKARGAIVRMAPYLGSLPKMTDDLIRTIDRVGPGIYRQSDGEPDQRLSDLHVIKHEVFALLRNYTPNKALQQTAQPLARPGGS